MCTVVDCKLLLNFVFFFSNILKCTRKIANLWAAFSSSYGGLQPSAARVRPFGPSLVFSGKEKFWRNFFFLQKKNLVKKISGKIYFLAKNYFLAVGSWQVTVDRWWLAGGRW